MQPLQTRSVYSSMKSIRNIIIITAVALGIYSTAQAQEEEYKSLFSLKNTRGYVGIHGGALALQNNALIATSGGSAAVIFNHKLALGFTGTGFIGFQNVTVDNTLHSMTGGYGGLLIEPILASKRAVHLSFPISLGIGENQYFQDPVGYRDWDWNYRDEFVQDFVYIQPGVNVEVNLTKFMRFGVTGSYLLTNVVNTTPVASSQLDGLSVSANLKLGWFK